MISFRSPVLVLFLGPLDMSASAGCITETDSRKVQAIMKDFPKRLEGSGITPATTLSNINDIEEKIEWGYRYINIGSPLAYGVQVVQGYMDRLRKNDA